MTIWNVAVEDCVVAIVFVPGVIVCGCMECSQAMEFISHLRRGAKEDPAAQLQHYDKSNLAELDVVLEWYNPPSTVD